VAPAGITLIEISDEVKDNASCKKALPCSIFATSAHVPNCVDEYLAIIKTPFASYGIHITKNTSFVKLIYLWFGNS
jgi:hypothetical protein